MANVPEISVRVAAEIAPLQVGMRQAEQAVSQATTNMATTVQRAGLGQKFDDWMAAGSRGAKRLNLALGASATAAAVAAGDIEGAMNSLPGVFGIVAGSAFKLGGAIHEAFTGAKAEAEALKKAVEEIERRAGFKAIARDAERLIQIEEAGTELARIELTKRREIALIRQQLLSLETEGATMEAVAAVAAQERLAIVKAEQATKKELARQAAEAAAAEEKSAEAAKRAADERERERNARRDALAIAITETNDNAATLRIIREQDEYKKRELELEQELVEIRRDRFALAEKIGNETADDLIRSRELIATTKARADLDRIAADRMNEYREAQDKARQSEEKRIADTLKSELDAKRKLLGESRDVSSFTQSIQTSIGGSFSVANLGANAAMRAVAERQAALQTRIAELVEQIRNRVGSNEVGIA